MFWPFTVWRSCSSDLKNCASSRLPCLNFQRFFLLLTRTNFSHSRTEQFSIKIPFLSPHFLVKQKISHRKKLGAKKVPVCKWKLAWNLHCQLRPWGLVSTTSLVEHSDPQQKKYRRIVNWKTCNYLENQLFKISCIRQSS